MTLIYDDRDEDGNCNKSTKVVFNQPLIIASKSTLGYGVYGGHCCDVLCTWYTDCCAVQ